MSQEEFQAAASSKLQGGYEDMLAYMYQVSTANGYINEVLSLSGTGTLRQAGTIEVEHHPRTFHHGTVRAVVHHHNQSCTT